MRRPGYVNGQARAMHDYIERAVRIHPDILTREALRGFFQRYCAPGVLLSFGDFRVDMHSPEDVLAPFARNIDIVSRSQYLSGLPLYRDSGGFQLQTGKISKDRISDLLKINIELTRNHYHQVTDTFTLDVVPTGSCRFSSRAELLRINEECLRAFANMPLRYRKTVLAIHHFKTPGLLSLSRRLLFDSDAASTFFAFATGGMASSDKAFSTPCIPYVIPLIDVIDHIRSKGRYGSPFGFHILGKGDYQDDIAQCLFTKLIADIHGIDINFTWDTAGHFNGTSFSQLAYYPIAESRCVDTLSFAYDNVHSFLGRTTATAAEFYGVANRFLGHTDIESRGAPLYEDDRPSAFLNLVVLMMHCAAHFESVRWCREDAQYLYPLWRKGKKADFKQKLREVIARLPRGQSEKGIINRVDQISRSMDILKDANPGLAQAVVRDCLGEDEYPELADDGPKTVRVTRQR